MIYPVIVTIALLSVWGTVAYMSIMGLVAVFSTQPAVAACLAGGLELGKLITIIHLHRNWGRHTWLPRAAYIGIVVVLTTLTAIEAGGYLVQTHQADIAPLEADRAALATLAEEQAALRHRIGVVDDTLNQLPVGYVTRRIAERDAAGYEDLQQRLAANIASQGAIRVRLSKAGATASPVTALARLSGLPAPTALLLFVCLLVAITEPLSIGLAVATSAAWIGRRQKPAEKAPAKPAAEAPAETDRPGKKQTTEPPQTRDSGPTAETGHSGQNRPAEMAPGHDSHQAEFLAIVARYRLTVDQVAGITGRKKPGTVKSWMDGAATIPIKALRQVRRWEQRRPRLVRTTTAASWNG